MLYALNGALRGCLWDSSQELAHLQISATIPEQFPQGKSAGDGR